MTVLKELLRIKVFREKQAQALLKAERLTRSRKTNEKLQAEQEAHAQKIFAEKEEEALFGGLIGCQVRVQHIEDVRGKVGESRNKTEQLNELFRLSVISLQKAQEDVDAAQAAMRVAEQTTAKFVELLRLHDDEVFREVERREDLELEEAASVARERDDMQQPEYEQT